MPSKTCLSAILPYKSSRLLSSCFVSVCARACTYIWEIWWNRQIISTRGKQDRSKKHQWIKANRSLKTVLSFFLFLLFFRLLFPLLFSSYVHAPCAHYKERKRQVCITLNEFVVMKWCLMSSDVSWHIRDKLWPMPKHGSIIFYVHGNQKAR